MNVTLQPQVARWLSRLLVLAALVVIPLLLGAFRLGLLTELLIFGLLAASLDLLVGYTGLPSLGHATYFGVGGYVGAVVAREVSSDALLALVVGTLAATLVAVVTGWLAVRTRGVYFLMLTLAFAQLLFSLALTWQPVTGGANGLPVPQLSLFGGAIALRGLSLYYYVLVLVALCYAALRRLVDSPFGRTIVGVRENEARMRSLGYSLVSTKLASFTVAGAFGGVAGLLFMQFNRFISPANVAFEISALALIMVIMGGVGTLYGPVLGAAAVLLLRDELSARFEHWEIGLGIVFIAFVYFLPRGLGGIIRGVSRRVVPTTPHDRSRELAAATEKAEL